MAAPGRNADPTSRRLLSARRALLSLAVGLAAGMIVGFLATPRLVPLVSWTVTVTVLLIRVWWISWPQDDAGTKRLAEQESSTRSTDLWLIAASVASLAGVVVALVQSSSQRNATAAASVLLSVLSVALSWALVNTVYAFKYARLYYLRRAGHRWHRLQTGRCADLQRLRLPRVHSRDVVRCL